MSRAVRSVIRRGTYLDSVVLMQIQHALSLEPGVAEAGVMMALPSNLEILAARKLITPEMSEARPDDLLISVGAETGELAEAAIDRFDALLAERRPKSGSTYRPRSLEGAFDQMPEARWVSISVPGRWAAEVADRVLDSGRNVFLYSDNVSIDDEARLKRKAAERGLMVMGPDCGTAIVGGVGLGFSNRVRRGSIGLVGASGTGLQAITSRIHALGGGISHALGTGGRDLSASIGAIAARQGLDLLARDEATETIVLVSKPPEPAVADRLLAAARSCGKPVIVSFLGYEPPRRSIGSVTFARHLEEAAELALGEPRHSVDLGGVSPVKPSTPDRRWLRGLFSGGTLATEVEIQLRQLLAGPAMSADGRDSIVDLGDDEHTVGRPHPMIDNSLRLERLAEEAADPSVAMILIDVVLGDGAHPDPAGELAPAIKSAREVTGGALGVVALLVGTESDPQDIERQREQLAGAGARVFLTIRETVGFVSAFLASRSSDSPIEPSAETTTEATGRDLDPSIETLPPVALDVLGERPAVINVGVETFYDSLLAQEASVVHVDWRPPAGGDERLLAILAKLRRSSPRGPVQESGETTS